MLIPEGCFPKARYFNLQGSADGGRRSHVDLPALTTLEIEDGVMENGGFCIMRSRHEGACFRADLYPTTIHISRRSLLCSASSYKSIPKELRRAIVKNLSPFQTRIASDAFLGQALVGSISALGIISVLVVLLICCVCWIHLEEFFSILDNQERCR